MLRISVLGDLRIEVAGAPAPLPASRRARSLLAWLALHRGEHSRSEVAGRFWPDVMESSARTSLRGAVAELRRSLGEAGEELVATRERLGLRRGPSVWIDAGEFADHVRAGRWEAALELARGELLADLDDDWVYPLREVHRDELAALHERCADAAEASGDLAGAIASSRRQAALDPLSEEVHRLLMRRLAASGDRAAAIAVYNALAERFRRELGMAPSTETRTLLDELRSGDERPAAVGAVNTGVAEPADEGEEEPPLEPPASLAAATALVGRDAELAALDDAWQEAAAGRARLALIEGDAGIGKTTLAREAAARAAAKGATVVYGRSSEEGIVPYEPWVEIAAHTVAHASPRMLGRFRDGAGPELARLAPELRRRIPDLPPPVAAEPDTERWRLFDAVSAMLDDLGRERSAVVVLDDLHWADRSTLLLLRHVLRSRPEARLLIIATYRGVELAGDAPLAAAIPDLRRGHVLSSHELGGLTEADVAALVARQRGAAAEPAFVRALHQETEGNPFFVAEVLRDLPADEEMALGGGVPEGVREAVERRLSRLARPVRDLLAIAAVIGRDFDLDVLERLPRRADDDPVALLEEAIGAHVIEEVGVGRYSFLHALIRTTLYEGLSLTMRARLHLQVGQALEELHVDSAQPPFGELAHHFWAAAARDLDRVTDYSAQASREALGQLAYEEAAGHARRGLQALAAVDPSDGRRRAELELLLGEAESHAGHVSAAREAFSAAAATARGSGDADALGTAALGYAGPPWRTFGEVDAPAVELLEEALAELGEGRTALRAKLLARLAVALYFADVPERVAALTDEAVATARAAGDAEAIAASLEAHLQANWHPDGVDARLEASRELLELAEAAHRPELACLARRWLAAALIDAGEVELARAESERHARGAAERRLPYEEMYASMFSAMWALVEGRYDEAERHCEAVGAAGEHRGGADAMQFLGVQAVSTALDRGGLEALEPALRAYADRYAATPAWRAGLACALAIGGRHDDARAELRALSPIAERLPRDANWLPGMALLARVAELLADAQLAIEVRELLVPYAGRPLQVGAGGALWGTVSRYLGLLAATAGEPAAAIEWLEDALAREGAIGARPSVADVEARLASALLARGERGDAERADELLLRARGTAEELGLAPLLDRLAQAPAAKPGPLR